MFYPTVYLKDSMYTDNLFSIALSIIYGYAKIIYKKNIYGNICLEKLTS